MANTTQESILIHLKKGYTISPAIAATEFNCYCLAAVIQKLRKKGYDIQAEDIPNTKTRRYYLDRSIENEK